MTNGDNRPRGLRNCNPGNIRHSKDKWEGLCEHQDADKFFAQFISPVYGIRALCKTLLTYQRKHGLKTIEEMIFRWAPPEENETDDYVRFVCKHAVMERDVPISLIDQPSILMRIAKAIIIMENGIQPYDESTIGEGVALAIA